MIEPARQRRPRRRATRTRWLLAVAAGLMLFGLGVAVGEALHDNPKPGITHTSVRTLHP
jgi:hypothetical protein